MINRRPFAWQIFARTVLIHSLIVLCALAATAIGARHFFKQHYLAQTQRQLVDTLISLSSSLPIRDQQWCATHATSTDMRFTVIDPQGTVLCDSHHDPASMENHLDRPEIIDAFKIGHGSSVRFSHTLGQSMLYGAVSGGDRKWVLRGAISLAELERSLRVYDFSLAVALLILAVLSVGLLAWEGRQFVKPINRILEKTRSVLQPGSSSSSESDFKEASFGEWTELEDTIEGIRKELGEKIDALTRERGEQETLMSSISDGIIAVDVEERPLFYNTIFALQFFPEERRRTFLLWEVVREPEVLQAFRKALRGEGGSVTPAVLFERDARRRYFSVSVAPLRKATGEVYGAVGIFHDVTELKRAEQIRIDFVANVSHELRTPLTSIKGYADTIAEDMRAGRQPENVALEAIERNTQRLTALIDDLLDLSALESTDTIQTSEISTEELTTRVIEQMMAIFQQKNQMTEVNIQAPKVKADARRVEQVLTNLMDNARKYSPEGSTIRVSWVPGRAGEVLLKVSDNGPGIPPEHHSRLFERFYRVDRARSREMGGTGLGLAIVKHIMQRHGGSIEIESVPGTGSTFVCRFPG